jgi:hypothetical protein
MYHQELFDLEINPLHSKFFSSLVRARKVALDEMFFSSSKEDAKEDL